MGCLFVPGPGVPSAAPPHLARRSPPRHTDARTSVLPGASTAVCRWRLSGESLLPSPSGMFPRRLLSDVCVSDCGSWVPSPTLGGVPQVCGCLCARAGVSVCLAVSPAESALDLSI